MIVAASSRTDSQSPPSARRRLLRAACRLCVEALAVPEPVRPSQWAEQHIVLKSEETQVQPGPYSCAVRPWLKAVHDAKFDNPGKLGVIIVKPSQVMVTRAILNMLFCAGTTTPLNILYMMDIRDKAGDSAVEKFDASVGANETLQRVFGPPEGRKRLRSRKGGTAWQPAIRQSTKTTKKFPGGRWDFVGGGSPGGALSVNYSLVAIDEFDRTEKLFQRGKVGSVWTVAKGRFKATPDRENIWVFSHPTTWEQGVGKLWQELSDCRVWTFDCPHPECKAPVRLKHWHELVRMGVDGKGRLIPETAMLHCPTCGKAISEAQRAVATWPADMPGREGGSGRFESELASEVASTRQYVGLYLHRLADPEISVVAMARELTSCTSEQDRIGVMNMTMGEPYVASRLVVDERSIERCMRRMDNIVLPGGRGGVRLLTVGADVQGTADNPVIVYQARAYDASGNAFVIEADAVAGFAAFAARLRLMKVRRVDDAGVEMPPLSVSTVGIDPNHLTSQVLDFCRWSVISTISNAVIKLVAMRFMSQVSRDAPARLAPDEKRTNPMAPHLGTLPYWYLNRHAWVDREMRRVAEERLLVVCVTPPEYKDHYMSNMLQMVEHKQAWGKEAVEEWVLAKGKRDDYMMGGVYSEAAAALECSPPLDMLGQIEFAPPLPDKRDRPKVRNNWVQGWRR
jgi:phage terminase large subunit GpA-like protein